MDGKKDIVLNNKIIFFGGVDNWTGSPISTTSSIRTLKPNIHKCIIIKGGDSPGPMELICKELSVPLYVLPKFKGPTLFKFFNLIFFSSLLSIYIIFISFKFKSIYIYISGLYGIILIVNGIFYNVKIIFHSHEILNLNNILKRYFINLLFLFVDKFIVVSNYHKNSYSNFNSLKNKIFVLYNNVNTHIKINPFYKIININKTFRVAYVGGASTKKGIHKVYEISNLLGKEYTLDLFISTAGECDKSLINKLIDKGIHVEFDVHDIPKRLIDYDFLIVPTLPSLCAETFGRILVEAAGAGCWPIVTPSGAYPEIIGLLGVGTILSPSVFESNYGPEFIIQLHKLSSCRNSLNLNLNEFSYNSYSSNLLNLFTSN